jgi:polyhydroxyalkanoate synthesis regulator phasin
MKDLFNRALLVGLGLASLTKDAIRKTAEDMVNRSKISEEEGRRLVKDLQRRSARARKALEKQVDSAVHKVFENVDLSTVIKNRLKRPKATRKAAPKGAAKRPRRRRTTKAAKR